MKNDAFKILMFIALFTTGTLLSCTESINGSDDELVKIPTKIADPDVWERPGPKASGHGNIDFPNGKRTFSFNMKMMELHARQANSRLHGDVDCVEIDGNTAVISGIITQATDTSLVGLSFYFRAKDMGEGRNNPPDSLTLVLPGAPWTCLDPGFLQFLPIEGGNIQVR